MRVVAFREEKEWDQGRVSMWFLVCKLGEKRSSKVWYGLGHYVSNVHVINSLVNTSAIT